MKRIAPSVSSLMRELRMTREEAIQAHNCMHVGRLTWVTASGFFGVETALDNDDRPLFYYLNSGDTYSPTIVRYSGSSRYFISTMGDCIEALERRGVHVK